MFKILNKDNSIVVEEKLEDLNISMNYDKDNFLNIYVQKNTKTIDSLSINKKNEFNSNKIIIDIKGDIYNKTLLDFNISNYINKDGKYNTTLHLKVCEVI